MLNIGDVIHIPGSLNLRIVDMRGTWVKCEYYDVISKTWKPRGYTLKRSELESKIKSGAYEHYGK